MSAVLDAPTIRDTDEDADDVPVSAVIVTRGDVDIKPILQSLPYEWEKVVWTNARDIPFSKSSVAIWDQGWTDDDMSRFETTTEGDLAVYGRYVGVHYAKNDALYVQDDDVIVSRPQEIVDEWVRRMDMGWVGGVVANMPQEFRHEGYTDSCLVGFGACFGRECLMRFVEFLAWCQDNYELAGMEGRELFSRTCDVVFTTLSERYLVDVRKDNMPYANDDNRMWRQSTHVGERTRMLELARRARDAR